VSRGGGGRCGTFSRSAANLSLCDLAPRKGGGVNARLTDARRALATALRASRVASTPIEHATDKVVCETFCPSIQCAVVAAMDRATTPGGLARFCKDFNGTIAEGRAIALARHIFGDGGGGGESADWVRTVFMALCKVSNSPTRTHPHPHMSFQRDTDALLVLLLLTRRYVASFSGSAKPRRGADKSSVSPVSMMGALVSMASAQRLFSDFVLVDFVDDDSTRAVVGFAIALLLSRLTQ
jgi:hypothetical protein